MLAKYTTIRIQASEAYVTFSGRQSKAMADQLTTVSKKRLINKAGSLSFPDMEAVARAITTQLDI
jgi:mRNA interferase MazF